MCWEWLQVCPGSFSCREQALSTASSGRPQTLPASHCRRETLTEVGELHSLTDWQVSEASEDAELEDFCHAEAGRCADGEGKPGGEERTRLVMAPARSGPFQVSAPPHHPYYRLQRVCTLWALGQPKNQTEVLRMNNRTWGY